MDTPGSILRTERENQNKTLRDISKRLKLTVSYLEAIEDDEYSVFPAPVFIRSYLRLFATELGLDVDSIIRLYTEQYESAAAGKETKVKYSFPFRISLNALFSGRVFKAILIGIIIATIAIFIPFLTKSTRPTHSKAERNDSPEDTVNKPVNTAVQKTDELRLTVIARELTWVSVSIDESNPKEWILRPEQSIDLSAMNKFAIKVGNAGGTRLIFNNEDLGQLGPHGKVIDMVLGADTE